MATRFLEGSNWGPPARNLRSLTRARSWGQARQGDQGLVQNHQITHPTVRGPNSTESATVATVKQNIIKRKFPSEIREMLWLAVFKGTDTEYPFKGSHITTKYPIGILGTCKAFRNEAKDALRKHFSRQTLFYDEELPPKETDENNVKDQAVKVHIRFLKQYGDCFKKILVYSSFSHEKDRLSLDLFPNLEVLELGSGLQFVVEADDITVEGRTDEDLLGQAWKDCVAAEVPEDDDDDDEDGGSWHISSQISEDWVAILNKEKGVERHFNIHLRLNIIVCDSDDFPDSDLLFDMDNNEVLDFY